MMSRSHALVMALVLAGCRAEPELPKFSAVPRAEAEAFGQRFAELLATCDPDKMAAAWDMDITIQRALTEAKLSGFLRASVARELTGRALWRQQCDDLLAQEGSTTRYLGLREVGGGFRPLVRMTSADGLNYTELELGGFPDGVRAVDALYYHTGEQLSLTLARLLKSTLTAIEDGDAEGVMQLQRIAELQREGDVEGALRLIRGLPPELRRDKAVMLMEITLDPADDDARYLSAIERFEKEFPNDPALDVVSIDGFLLRKQYERYHASLDRLDARTDDAYLDVLRAAGFQQAGDLDKAMTHLTRATTREPELEAAWDAMFGLCLTRKDYACAVTAMRRLDETFGVKIPDAQVPDFIAELENGQELVASDAWKAWRGAPP